MITKLPSLPRLATERTVAMVTGVSRYRVRDLAERGVIPVYAELDSAGRGGFVFDPAVEILIAAIVRRPAACHPPRMLATV